MDYTLRMREHYATNHEGRSWRATEGKKKERGEKKEREEKGKRIEEYKDRRGDSSRLVPRCCARDGGATHKQFMNNRQGKEESRVRVRVRRRGGTGQEEEKRRGEESTLTHGIDGATHYKQFSPQHLSSSPIHPSISF